MMRRHRERGEISYTTADDRPATSPRTVVHRGRMVFLTLTVPTLGRIVLRLRESPDDSNGRLDLLTAKVVS